MKSFGCNEELPRGPEAGKQNKEEAMLVSQPPSASKFEVTAEVHRFTIGAQRGKAIHTIDELARREVERVVL